MAVSGLFAICYGIFRFGIEFVRVPDAHIGYLAGGWFVVVDHGNGWTSSYSHLSAIHVREGQGVGRGTPIALSGGTPGHPGAGRSTGPHLHYAIKHRGQPVDPVPITAWNGWQLTRG